MTHRTSIGIIAAAYLIGAPLVATGAHAGGRTEHAQPHQGQQAAMGLGDSKCMLVGEVVKCVPAVAASS